MKARILSGSFSPGARSTPEETSTPGARVMRSASATLPASSPPESMNGTPASRFSSSRQSNALAEPARPRRLARRAGVEDQPVGDLVVEPDRRRGRRAPRSAAPSSPAGRSACAPRPRAPASRWPCSCSRSGCSASMMAASMLVVGVDRERDLLRPAAHARAERARGLDSRDCAARAERTRSRPVGAGVERHVERLGRRQAADFDQNGHGRGRPCSRAVLPRRTDGLSCLSRRLIARRASSRRRRRDGEPRRVAARHRRGRQRRRRAPPLAGGRARRAARAPPPRRAARRGAICSAAARRRCRPRCTPPMTRPRISANSGSATEKAGCA